MSNSQTKLKKCPFCGGPAKYVHEGHWHKVSCNSKCKISPETRWCNEKTSAYDRWNYRSS